MFCSPKNVTFFHLKLLLYNFKFHNINDEQVDTITSLTLHPCICWRCYHHYVW